MKFSCGIIGLPNVGKSSLFNLLTKLNVKAYNYPFCTISPNIGISIVPDIRQKKISEIIQTKKIIPATIKFVDIAGLVKGASLGEGLGNKFLSNIRETTAIIHVIRCFNINNDHKISPEEDINIINTELLLSDIDLTKKKIEKKIKLQKYHLDKDIEINFLKKLYEHLNKGENALSFYNIKNYKDFLYNLSLLTIKPTLFVINISNNINNTYINKIKKIADNLNSNCITLSIINEKKLLDSKENNEENNDLILNKLIKEAYKLLGLITFFSVGEKEIRAWSIKKNASILEAAKKIHSDIKRGFIKAEVISYENFIKYKGEYGSKISGKCRIEGKKYIVKDGDIINFKFNI